jgi:His-Xaa-Ser system protein HxsD
MVADATSASAFFSGSDELGVYARVSIDPKVFSETAVLKTAYWFTDQYYLYLAGNRDTGLLDVEFRLKQGDSVEKLKAVCGEFMNGILDQAVRQRVLQETTSLRDTLLKKAFFDAKAPLPQGTVSDESRLAQGGQSYRDDPVKAGRQD